MFLEFSDHFEILWHDLLWLVDHYDTVLLFHKKLNRLWSLQQSFAFGLRTSEPPRVNDVTLYLEIIDYDLSDRKSKICEKAQNLNDWNV